MKRKIPDLDKRYSKHRPLREEEIELWRAAMEGSMGKIKTLSQKPAKKTELKKAPPKTLPVAKPAASVLSHLDKPTLAKIRRGGQEIDATLDLHGYRLDEAYEALVQFIARAQATDKRLVLVITGKGRAGGVGALKRELPRWLGETALRGRIIAYDSAGARHGGSGAWYIRIKKKSKTHE